MERGGEGRGGRPG
ncbi:hypothetical protein CP10139811_1489A, partial [Chlamydia ibidis]